MMRENEIVLRDRFFPDRNYNLSLCSSIDSKRVVVRGNARGEERQLDTRETHTQREREREEKREQIRTRVLLDFRFHPSLQSVVERFQKRRAVNVSSRGVRRRRRQRRDRRRARDRFLQRAAAFFATTIPPPVCCFCHDDDD